MGASILGIPSGLEKVAPKKVFPLIHVTAARVVEEFSSGGTEVSVS